MPSAPSNSDTVFSAWSSKLAKKYIKALDRQQYKRELLHPIWLKCRQIAPVISPFLNIFEVFYTGTGVVGPNEDEDQDDVEHDEEEKEKSRAAFKAILSIHPHLPGIVKSCMNYPDTFGNLIHMVELASSGARGDDTAKLRDGILTIMFEDPRTQTVGFIPELQQDALLPGSEKSRRGWAYIETAYLLCPERYLEEFKQDPELFMEQVHSGDRRIDPHDIPHFCYDEDARHDENMDEEYDEIEGLFGGFLIKRGLRHIFTGPKSALNPFHRPPRSKGKGWGLDAVTPEMIAYTCVQLYVSLSSMKEWDSIHNHFDLTAFYDHIVRIMKDNSDDEWCEKIIQSLTKDVPGLKVATKRKKQTSNFVDHSSTQPPAYERIKAQLERRKIRQQQHVQQAQLVDHLEKRNRNVGGGGRREPEVIRQAGGGNKVAQRSRPSDTRQEGPTNKEIVAATEQAHRGRQEAVAVEKERRRKEKEHEEVESEMSLEDAVHAWLGSTSDKERRYEEEEVLTKKAAQEKRRSQVEEDREMQVVEEPGRQKERSQQSQTVRSVLGSQAVGSSQLTKMSSQRREHQEKLASQYRCQTKIAPSEESLTEPESDQDISIQPPHKKGTPSQESLTEPESDQDVPPQPPHLSRGNKRDASKSQLQNDNDATLFKKPKLPTKHKPAQSVVTTTSLSGTPRRSQRPGMYTGKYAS